MLGNARKWEEKSKKMDPIVATPDTTHAISPEPAIGTGVMRLRSSYMKT